MPKHKKKEDPLLNKQGFLNDSNYSNQFADAKRLILYVMCGVIAVYMITVILSFFI